MSKTVVVTAHVMDRYRERVDLTAKVDDVVLSFKQAVRLPKDRASWPPLLSTYPAKAGACYYWDEGFHLVYVAEESLNEIRLVTVYYPDIQAKPLEQRLAEPEPTIEELKARAKSIASRKVRLKDEVDFLGGQLKRLEKRIRQSSALTENLT